MNRSKEDSLKVDLISNGFDGEEPQKWQRKSSVYRPQRESIYSDITKKIYPEWQTSQIYKFIQFWQAVFNRRILNCCSFTIQVGDVLFFLSIVSYLVVACLFIHKDKKSGKAASVLLGATIVFGCRNGLLSYIFGLSFERAVFWHKFMAWITLGLSINHWYYSKYLLSGYFIEGVLIALIVFSIEPIRRNFWEFFLKLHWVLIIGMFVCCIVHEVGLGIMATCYFSLDLAIRVYLIRKYCDSSVQMSLERIGQNIVKVQMHRQNIDYKGGQYFFLMIPKLSYYQWHPFSAFSAPHEDELVFYIKAVGDWTNYLYMIAGKQGNPVTVKGYIDGPYGTHSISIESDKYQNFLCISGGIGVTPIISTAKQLLHEIQFGRPVSNLHFIWTGRDQAIIERIFKPDELNKLVSQKDEKIVQTFFHYTEESNNDSNNSKKANNKNHIELDDIESKTKKKSKKAAESQHNSKQNNQTDNGLVKYQKGRPNLSKYFEKAFKAAKKSNNDLVAVIACGPQPLLNAVEATASDWSKEGIRFDVHQEVFEF